MRSQAGRVRLVWTPQKAVMVVPEEVPELGGVLRELGLRAAARDRGRGLQTMVVCGVVALVVARQDLLRGDWRAVVSNGWVGGLLLVALMFGAIPWYRGWKEERSWRSATDDAAEDIAEARFESWLGMQRGPVTAVLIALTVVVGLLQVVLPGEGWKLAGLVKEAVRDGERWRLLTAPWLHGHPVHWFVNVGALAYLGKRCEALARWPHLVMVFLVAAWLGGEASVWLVSKASVGASGGLLGLLGFLLVFETLHRKLVPVSARRRLLAGVLATGVLGLVGFRFIDNAAHAGGLVAGMVYAAVVFPPSASPVRPRTLVRDRIFGSLVGAVLVGSGLFAGWMVAAG